MSRSAEKKKKVASKPGPRPVKPGAEALEKRLLQIGVRLRKSGLPSEDILARFASELRKILKLDGVFLWYFLKDADYRLFMSTPNLKSWFDHMPPEQAGLGAFVQKPNAHFFNPRPEHFAGMKTFYENFSLKPEHLAAFSLDDNSKKVLIGLFVSEKKQLSKAELAAARNAAFELNLAVRNAQLQKISEKESEQTQTILEISRILNSTLNPKTVRTRAMEGVVKLLDCEAGSLYLIDEARGEIYFEVALGEAADQVKEIRLKIGEGISGWVAETGQSLLIPDVAKDPRWASKVDKKSKFQTKNMVTVPVKTRNKIIGVLQAVNKCRGRSFNQADLKLMESLADSVAIALENALLHDEQRRTFFETAEALADAIEKRDPYTGGHTRRVRDFSKAITEELSLDKDIMERLDLAAILHDVGKIGVEDRVLRKPGRLTDEEFACMCLHPEYGSEILSHIKSLGKVIPGMRHHHERLDGRGYPAGLKNSQIPQIARIISVADTWDAMTSDRPYRPALSEDAALKELWQSRGKQLDPQMVTAFFKAYKKGKIYTQQREKSKAIPAQAQAVLTQIARENKLEWD